MFRKGQAAMEYLMTYGWAILIVVIVAAALFALGVFNPGTYVTQTGTGFPNLGLPEQGSWQLQANGNFNMILKNNRAQTINITNINSTLAGTTYIATINGSTSGCGGTATDAWCQIGPGASVTFQPLDTFSGQTTGASYSVQIKVTYTPAGLFVTSDLGTFTGTVE